MTSDDSSTVAAKRHNEVRAARRSRARLMAVQALYQMDIAQTDLNEILEEFTSTRLEEDDPVVDVASEGEPTPGEGPFDAALFEDIARGVLARQLDVDPLIQQHLAEGWRLGRIDSTMRAILRSGAYEIVARDDVPVRVVISEYLDIAHAFFDGEEPKVVNAVLDRLARQRRAQEVEKVHSGAADNET